MTWASAQAVVCVLQSAVAVCAVSGRGAGGGGGGGGGERGRKDLWRRMSSPSRAIMSPAHHGPQMNDSPAAAQLEREGRAEDALDKRR